MHAKIKKLSVLRVINTNTFSRFIDLGGLETLLKDIY